MKILFSLLLVLLSVPDIFARTTCTPSGIQMQMSNVEMMSKSSDVLACIATKEAYQCEKMEADLEANEKYKIIKCDEKSIEANRLGNTSIADCVWNGLKISGEQLLDLGALPGKIAEGISKGFKETQLCNSSIEKKREILNAYNLTMEDERFRLSEQFLGRWLEEANCSEIEKQLSARYQNYLNVTMRERVLAVNMGKRPAPIKSEKSGPNLVDLFKQAMKEAEATYHCYTPKVKAEMVCAGVTSLLADIAVGGGVVGAAKKISAIVKSKKALGRIERAVAAGEKADLKDAARLLDGDRIKGAQAVLKRELSEAEKKAILEAHEVGIKEGRGFYSYTQEDLLKKARTLREAGLDSEQTRALMENGITGMFNDPTIKKAMLAHFQKMFTTVSLVQQDALVAIHNLGRSSAAGFTEKAKAMLKEAKFTDDQIEKILKAKSNQENGIREAVASTPAPAKPPVTSSASAARPTTPVAPVKPATPAAPTAPAPATPVAQTVADSPGRKAVLNNFRDDEYLKIQHTEIPDNLTGEALEAKKRARRANAQEIIKKIEKKERREFDPQAVIIENGEAVSKSKKALAEAEEQMAKLPKVGADMRRKDLQDKIDRSSTSLEMYQKKCKAALELYREAHGYEQYMRQYQRDYDNYCK